ncbi:MAG: cadmium-translocating P-type ATPase [Candidatus Methanogranum gryphiswaldense]|nr:MAG: cadmium-translocating P-type ATPase [Candidatus Methanogranum sp. U3.2.1]
MSEKIILRTGGMSCASCSAKIERTVGKLNGVLSVNANFSENTVFVEFDPEKISSEYISDAIRKSGYDVLEGDNDTIMEKERKESIALKRDLTISVVFTAILMIMAMGPMLGLNIPFHDNAELYSIIQLILCIPVIFSGRRFYIRGIPSLLRGNPTMDTLIALGTLAAIIYSLYSIITIFQGNDSAMHSLFFDSAAMIITLVSVGKYLESRSKVRTNDAVKGLMDLAPPTAEIERGKDTVTIPIEEVNIGDITVIRPGNRIPIDGKVIEGLSHVDESMLTGESMPVKKTIGDEVYSGTTNSTGVLRAEVTRIGGDTALSKIVRMIKDAQSTKAPVARIADKVASIFVPVVILIAVAAAVLWMLAGKGLEFSLVILISVLVISCPCALGLATPLAITVGTGRAAEYGILFKDAATLERSGNISEIILDKTGTLTEGSPKVERIITDIDEKEFIAYVASAESVSEHPLGKAVISYAKDLSVEIYRPEEFTSVTGKGIICTVKGKNVIVGNDRLLMENKIEFSDNISNDEGMTQIYVAIDGIYVGSISMGDPVRKTSRSAVSHLKKMNINVTMVTGDSDSTAKKIAKETGIENIISKALPEDKINIVKKIQAKGADVAMVGDGINDSPALIQADIGIAIGSGTDIAIDSADVILMNDDMRNIPATFAIGKATIRNIRQNLFFAFCYNVVCIPIAAGLPFLLGLSSFTEMPMIAALAMSCSSISVVLNSLRLKGFKPDCYTD